MLKEGAAGKKSNDTVCRQTKGKGHRSKTFEKGGVPCAPESGKERKRGQTASDIRVEGRGAISFGKREKHQGRGPRVLGL